MEARPSRTWPVLLLASAASLPVITSRLIAGGGGEFVPRILRVDHQMVSYAAAAAVLAVSWAWSTRAVEASESKPKKKSDDADSCDGRREADAAQHMITVLQNAWWTYVGLPLHFRATRVVGFAKALLQQSVVVAWESTRVAPKRFQLWIKKKGESSEDGAAHSLNLTFLERSKVQSVPHKDDCLAAVVDDTGPCSDFVRKTVPDSFLLHFGSLLGERSSERALAVVDRSRDIGTVRGLFGEAEDAGWADKPWKKPTIKSKPGLTFKLEKKYIRKGLFLYRTSAVIENADIKEFAHFNLSMDERKKWDWTIEDCSFVQPSLDGDADSGSGTIFLESRMPGPLANREYVFSRRIWQRRDGGCYSLCVSCNHPEARKLKGRNVRVDEFTTAYVMRPTKSLQGRAAPAIEVASLYFDAPKMRSMAYNLAMNSGMWTAVQSLEENYRKYSNSVKHRSTQSIDRRVHVTKREKRRALIKNLGGLASGACKVAVIVAVTGMAKGRPK